jgi:hypothetical protein
MVYADVDAGTYACECSKMKRDGVLCCHILKIMTQHYIEEIPAAYLLRRWSNGAGVIATPLDVDQSQLPSESCLEDKSALPNQKQPLKTIRYVDMCNEFAKVANLACTSEKATRIIRKHVEDMKAELTSFKLKNSKKQKTAAAEATASKVNDPPLYKPKGRPIPTRRKSGFNLEGAPKNPVCRICGSKQHMAEKCDNKLNKK